MAEPSQIKCEHELAESYTPFKAHITSHIPGHPCTQAPSTASSTRSRSHSRSPRESVPSPEARTRSDSSLTHVPRTNRMPHMNREGVGEWMTGCMLPLQLVLTVHKRRMSQESCMALYKNAALLWPHNGSIMTRAMGEKVPLCVVPLRKCPEEEDENGGRVKKKIYAMKALKKIEERSLISQELL